MTEGEAGKRVEIETQICALRDAGATWKEIQERFGLTRQQARYAYQRGKRTERRAARRAGE
jgi:hypothetical protein